MKTIYFTLCSNNYLPFAISLGKSVKQFLPDARFIIGLVDRINPEVDYASLGNFEFLPCFDLGYPEFETMLIGYNIIEFNTAVKPFYFEYFFQIYPDVVQVYYLDPDLVFFQSPIELCTKWGDGKILLTPNLIYTSVKPSTGELASLRHGANNLGFIGIRRGKEGLRFVHWWKDRLRTHCKIDKCKGIFVDQKWVDLAPLFFDRIKSVKHPGWNMAWWNFSERKLLKRGETLYVNSEEDKLIFFHFSGFKPGNRQITERMQSDEFAIHEDHLLQSLFDDYEQRLFANGFEVLHKVKPLLQFYKTPDSKWIRFGRKLKSKSNNLIYRIFKV